MPEDGHTLTEDESQEPARPVHVNWILVGFAAVLGFLVFDVRALQFLSQPTDYTTPMYFVRDLVFGFMLIGLSLIYLRRRNQPKKELWWSLTVLQATNIAAMAIGLYVLTFR